MKMHYRISFIVPFLILAGSIFGQQNVVKPIHRSVDLDQLRSKTGSVVTLKEGVALTEDTLRIRNYSVHKIDQNLGKQTSILRKNNLETDIGLDIERSDDLPLRTFSDSFVGLLSQSNSSAGIEAISQSSIGVNALSTEFYGLNAESTSGIAARGVSTSNVGVAGVSTSNYGILGISTNLTGIAGGSTNGPGLQGESANFYGVYGDSYSTESFDFFANNMDGSTAYGESSSIRWKTNIRSIPDPLEKIKEIRGVYFDWKPEFGGKESVGFVAEEVGKVFPEIVVYEENGIDAVGLDYSKMTPLLVEAVHAVRDEYQSQFAIQQRQIEDQEKEIAQLKSELQEIKVLLLTQSKAVTHSKLTEE